MFEKIVLHVGFHRTGSTTVQRELDNNRWALLDDGVRIPSFNISGRRLANHSVPIFNAFKADNSSYHANKVLGFDPREAHEQSLCQVESMLSQSSGTLVISGEDISSLNENELTGFLRFLCDHTESMVIFGLFRDPSTLVPSVYQEFLHSGRLFSPSLAALNAIRASSKIERFLALDLPNLRIKFSPYEKSAENDLGPFGMLLDVLGLSSANFRVDVDHRANKRMSSESARLIERLISVESDRGPIGESIIDDIGRVKFLSQVQGACFRLEYTEELEWYIQDERQNIQRLTGVEYRDKPILWCDGDIWRSSAVSSLMSFAPAIEESNLRSRIVECIQLEAEYLSLLDHKRAKVLAGVAADLRNR